MIPPLRSFDDVDGKERGQKKTDDLRAMTALGPRTLFYLSVYPLLNTLQTSDYDVIFYFCVDSASLATSFKKCNVIMT